MAGWTHLFYGWLVLAAAWFTFLSTTTARDWPTAGVAEHIYSLKRDSGELIGFAPTSGRWHELKQRSDLILVTLPSGAHTVVRKDWSESKRNKKVAQVWDRLVGTKQDKISVLIPVLMVLVMVGFLPLSLGFLVYLLRLPSAKSEES